MGLAEDESTALLQAMFGADDGDVPGLVEQIDAWRRQPFNPHLVARMRTIAYQKTVVMRYIENLVAWGDMLFRRDTLEAINEAAQLYVLASDILGPKPVLLPGKTPELATYLSLSDDLDAFGNALEPLVPTRPDLHPKVASLADALVKNQPPPAVRSLHFCIPRNDKLLGYWDTVADRLFKIRHCMNIEGVVRQLPLFEPPIDPALLVQAAAAGVDIGSVLNDVYTPQPYYRFGVLHGKAMEFSGAVVGLGQSLLSAIEKRDGEELAMLRSTQEVEILKSIKDTRKLQIKEAKENKRALEEGKKVVQARYEFYSTRSRTSDAEDTGVDLLKTAAVLQGVGAGIVAIGAVLYFTNDTEIGTAGKTDHNGGTHIGSAVTSAGSAISAIGGTVQAAGNIVLTNASFDRRHDEWKLQAALAQKELAQIDKQIVAADIRIAIAENELSTHEKQLENAAAVEAYLRDKYTNQDLYDWMVDTLSATYFQAYQLAFDMARRAERGYQFERCEPASKRFVSFGYWDSLRKGLLSGEKLQHDLRRLEAAYLAENKREYEITKHISLAQLKPEKLLELRNTGSTTFDVPETWFDQDFPGHYMRRIKSTSITIPNVTGPYASVNATLTLLNSTIRREPSLTSPTALLQDYTPIQSICTSGGQNDSGVFELSFRDERYLPFEGAGAVSTWRIEMPAKNNNFDMSGVNDVVLHLNYMAREGGATFRAAVENPDPPLPNVRTGVRLFSVKDMMAPEWNQFITTLTDVGADEDNQILTLPLTADKFPYLYGTGPIRLTSVLFFATFADPTVAVASSLACFATAPGAAEVSVDVATAGAPTGLSTTDPEEAAAWVGTWTLRLPQGIIDDLDPSLLVEAGDPSGAPYRLLDAPSTNIFVVCTYERDLPGA